MDTIYRLVEGGFGTETVGYFDSYAKAETFLDALVADRPWLWGPENHYFIEEIGINPTYVEEED